MANIASNLMASRSTIMDTDYATASSQLSRSQIIQQAATAMLAQANQQPESVLTLLK
jgi:flagellin